ncbi:arylamine N-acetyltransferase family protein [Terribacillus saccharophilus]|uniref:arylamine N-acetyltransferase family protein n=1 Tax=Terribacillus saccharophilus TaxID=361277 RepID=UPI003982ACF4
MQSFKDLFQQRINMDSEVIFVTLPMLLQQFSQTIPFENLRIIDKHKSPLSKEGLQEKILIRNEGGVCYELNTLLYHFLEESGFDVTLLSACIYDQKTNDWSATGNTHTTILLKHSGEKYIVDAGFGANVPLAPLPLSGEVMTTANGQFCIKPADEGYTLELKLADRDNDWHTGYVFSEENQITNMDKLQEMQQIIETHPASPFNKSPLLTRRTTNGLYILTPSSYTKWQNGIPEKQTIGEEEYDMLLQTIFNMQRLQ